MDSKKIDEHNIEITKTEVVETKTIYERSFIENQIKEIQKQKDEFDALRDKELEECNSILAKMDNLGITKKPVETLSELTP